MARKSYASILKSKKYVKIRSEYSTSFVNVRFMHMILHPADIVSIKIVSYEKKTEDGLLTSSVTLQFVKTIYNIYLKCMNFNLYKKIDVDDPKFKATISALLNEQMDIQEELEDLDFISL